MTIRNRLKAIIDNYGTQDLSINQLSELSQQLESEIVQEIGRRKLFVVTVEDSRDNIRSQFVALSKAMLAEGFEVLEDGNTRKDKNGDIFWNVYKVGDPTDTATLKLSKDNTWAIVPSVVKKGATGSIKSTDVMQRKSPETKVDSNWKFAN